MLNVVSAKLPGAQDSIHHIDNKSQLKAKLSVRVDSSDVSEAERGSDAKVAGAERAVCSEVAPESSRLLSWEFILYWLVSQAL